MKIEDTAVRRYSNRFPVPGNDDPLSNLDKRRIVERALADLFLTATSGGDDLDLSTLRIEGSGRELGRDVLEVSIDTEKRVSLKR